MTNDAIDDAKRAQPAQERNEHAGESQPAGDAGIKYALQAGDLDPSGESRGRAADQHCADHCRAIANAHAGSEVTVRCEYIVSETARGANPVSQRGGTEQDRKRTPVQARSIDKLGDDGFDRQAIAARRSDRFRGAEDSPHQPQEPNWPPDNSSAVSRGSR